MQDIEDIFKKEQTKYNSFYENVNDTLVSFVKELSTKNYERNIILILQKYK